jgi:hypothetical protein
VIPAAARTRTPSIPPMPRGSRPPTAPTDILAQQPPQPPPIPTAAVQTQELGLADGTGALLQSEAAELVPDLAPRRRRTIAIAAAIGVVVVGVAVFAMTRIGEPDERLVAKAEPKAWTTEPPKHVTVESIPNDQPTGSGTTQQPTTNAPNVKVEQSEQPQPQHVDPPTQPVHDTHKQPHKQTVKKVEPKHDALTRDAVAAKFGAVKREYDAYKAKNGGRLDGEWGDLATFIQYHLSGDNLEDAAKKIEAFRAKMRE